MYVRNTVEYSQNLDDLNSFFYYFSPGFYGSDFSL